MAIALREFAPPDPPFGPSLRRVAEPSTGAATRQPLVVSRARAGLTALHVPVRRLLGQGRGVSYETTGMAGVDAVAQQRTSRWFALVGLAWRSLAMMIALVGSLDWLRSAAELLIAVGVVVAVNMGLLLLVARRQAVSLLGTRAFFVIDVGAAAGLNLWASLIIPERSLYLPYHDLFAPYMWGTVLLWTALRRVGTGFVLLLAAAVPLQLAMASLDGFALAAVKGSAVVDRALWLVTSFVVAAIASSLAREAALATAAAALQAGREAERASMLRALHDTVLQTLEGIALQAGCSDLPAEQRLHDVRAAALQQASELRAALHEDAESADGVLVARLRTLALEFLGRGLRVEFLTTQLDVEPPARVAHALLLVTREALNNVVKHAGVGRAVLRVVAQRDGIQVTIRDQGRGFSPARMPSGYGLVHSVVDRMQEVGGYAEVWSAPGRGTRVRLWVPC